MLTLVIGNKNYSSWSLRPWLALRHFGVAFDEVVIPLDQPDTQARIGEYSPTGKVPVLLDDGVKVWESLAIIDYLADLRPDLDVWPRDLAARALARSASAEMHAGFAALRTACPMNIKRSTAWRGRGEDVARDVARITAILRECRERFGAGGAFLFGPFTGADAMFAPVVTRFATYSLPAEPVVRAYMDAVQELPAFQDWRAGALEESWSYPKTDEAA